MELSGIYRAALLAEAAQTAHGHRIVSGYVSRGVARTDDPVRQDPFFEYLASCDESVPSVDAARAALDRTGVRWVLVHLDWPRDRSGGVCTPPPGEVAEYLERSGLHREYADDRLIVYTV